MFLRFNRRFKDGKEHRYWNIVESKRCASGKLASVARIERSEIRDSFVPRIGAPNFAALNPGYGSTSRLCSAAHNATRARYNQPNWCNCSTTA